LTTELIPAGKIRRLAIYYYLVLFLWPVYLFFLPAVMASIGGWGILYMVFPGLYLFTWAGYLMHESWHKFVPNVNSRFFYNAFALMLLSDPQLYNLLHRTHHGFVNSYQDAEFHPLGEIRSRLLRILSNWLEVVFGIAYLVVAASVMLPRDPRFKGKYKFWKLPVSMLAWVVFFGGVGWLSHLVFPVAFPQVILIYALNFWLSSFFLHQSQLVEHGNLIVDGPLKAQNLRTRNMRSVGILERVFLFLTHNDSREHVLHHTMSSVHSRPFPGTIPLPEGAVQISLGGYLRILGQMLVGKVDRDVVS
jgi:hypothetical protein